VCALPVSSCIFSNLRGWWAAASVARAGLNCSVARRLCTTLCFIFEQQKKTASPESFSPVSFDERLIFYDMTLCDCSAAIAFSRSLFAPIFAIFAICALFEAFVICLQFIQIAPRKQTNNKEKYQPTLFGRRPPSFGFSNSKCLSCLVPLAWRGVSWRGVAWRVGGVRFF